MTIHHGIKLGFLPSTQSRTDLGVVRVSSALNYFYFLKKNILFIYLFDRERERERERQPAREGTQAGGVGEEEAGSQRSREPDVGLNPRTGIRP